MVSSSHVSGLDPVSAMDYRYNKKIMKASGLAQVPDRRTFDRRLSSISTDIKDKRSVMANHFIHE